MPMSFVGGPQSLGQVIRSDQGNSANDFAPHYQMGSLPRPQTQLRVKKGSHQVQDSRNQTATLSQENSQRA